MGAQGSAQTEGLFERSIRPLLASKCFACHGPDESHRAANLRLDMFEAVVQERPHGVVIVPGDPEGSLILRRVSHAEAKHRMPPEEAGAALTDAEVADLRAWISSGATYQTHWSFRPPRVARPFEVALAVGEHPIDALVALEHQKRGFAFAPAEDAHLLARRLAFDLTGLPPDPERLQAFVANPNDEAYLKLVASLLESPSYGERWASMWLDLARYADSSGYGSDPLRNIWRYRDWVIEAFQRNLPFDQFTIEQLAGDLLPQATEAQHLATAFHRNTMTNTEGGTDDEEFRVAAVKDRVHTTAEVWLGLTFQCAACHTHKFDPISHKEYYSFFDFFNQTEDHDQPDERPTRETPTEGERRERGRMEHELAALEEAIAHVQEGVDPRRLGAFEQAIRYRRRLGELREGVVQSSPVETQVARAAEILEEHRTDDDRRVLLDAYLAGNEDSQALRRSREDLLKKRAAFRVTSTPVMVERKAEDRRETHVLLKGNFLDKGEKVDASTPAALHAYRSEGPRNRLGLARWIMSPENPLTGRVTVNRFWARLFGVGIVSTEADFGVMGAYPSHPELLDSLAVWFRETNYDMKALIRLIVTSRTYRQSHQVRTADSTGDPSNRYLWRGPRRRLEAEMLFDQALAISGLLNTKIGGPSVFPLQPEGLWQAAFNGQRTWTRSTGEDRYRRAIYTTWRRTVPYPSLSAFGMTSREVCTSSRPVSQTPIQALALLNDPLKMEAAAALATRAVSGDLTDLARSSEVMFSLATSRPPSERERSALKSLFAELRKLYSSDPDQAARILRYVPEGTTTSLNPSDHAALILVANTILNIEGALHR
jgi:hypothetical protein